RRGQHPRPAARADPAPGHRQGTAGGSREGTRALAAALPGGAGAAAGRVLGAGPPPVRYRQRPVMTQSAADEAVPSAAGLFEIVKGGAPAGGIGAPRAPAPRHQDATAAPGLSGASIWAGRSRLVRPSLAHAPGGWRASARPR